MCPVWQLHNHWPLLYMYTCHRRIEIDFQQTNQYYKKVIIYLLSYVGADFDSFFYISDLQLCFTDLYRSASMSTSYRVSPEINIPDRVVFIYITKMTSLILNNLFFTFSCKCSTDDIILIPIVGNTKYFLKMSNKMYFSIFLPFWSELLILK